MKKEIHDTRSAQKMLAHGAAQGLGVFHTPKSKRKCETDGVVTPIYNREMRRMLKQK